MRVLLLGGTGAMGIALKDILAQRGDEVYITSRSVHADLSNIHYLKGDAHDDSFMAEVLKDGYDAIVDFMIYRTEEFNEKLNRLLTATNQYIFLSSSRVYAGSDTPITEDSPRLLDVCKDQEYLKTDEYALAKAREENIIFECNKKNWTIVRPYITYNIERLQLGCLEKEIWLRRAMEGYQVPLPKDMALCQTTMTYGVDVANAIAALIGNELAMGQIFNLTSTEHMTWQDVLEIYQNVLEKVMRTKTRVYSPANSEPLYSAHGNKYQFVYDRLYNRIFDNSKLQIACNGTLTFCSMKDGLTKCVSEFVKNPRWKETSPRLEAYLNKEIGEGTNFSHFSDYKQKLKYFMWYYTPGMLSATKKILR